jgi:hypothetical protein
MLLDGETLNYLMRLVIKLNDKEYRFNSIDFVLSLTKFYSIFFNSKEDRFEMSMNGYVEGLEEEDPIL